MHLANLFLLGPLLVALKLVVGPQTAVWGGACLVGVECVVCLMYTLFLLVVPYLLVVGCYGMCAVVMGMMQGLVPVIVTDLVHGESGLECQAGWPGGFFLLFGLTHLDDHVGNFGCDSVPRHCR
jgi:hypothetical protein